MAEKEYIDRETMLARVDEEFLKTDPSGEEQLGFLKCRRIIREIPAADVVGRSAYDQTKWERDIAMQQLADAGIPFGAKVEVVHAAWIPHEHVSRSPYARNYDCSACGNSPIETGDFCNKCGAKMDGGKDG